MLFLYPMCVKYSIAHWSDREYRWLFWVNVHFPLSAFLSVYVEKRLFHYQLERVLLTIVRQQLWGEIAVFYSKVASFTACRHPEAQKNGQSDICLSVGHFSGMFYGILALFPLRSKAWGYCPKLNDIDSNISASYFLKRYFLYIYKRRIERIKCNR